MEGTTPETWHVALQDLEKGHVKVVLTVAILGVLDADFLFKIVSLVVERIDSLDAKVRDLEEDWGLNQLMSTWPKKEEGSDSGVPFGRAVGGVKLLLDSVSCGTKNRDTITHTEFTTQISYVEVYYGQYVDTSATLHIVRANVFPQM
ncbi:hypothetical protein DYB26_015239 [Aphanomyces astaci]|nr:hypothetical protein DYB26_015239 [Aphanomyces astaci]